MSNHLEILRQNGKSFYWAGKLLPKKYFVRCAELYSFCRLLDDIADTNTKDENFIKLNFILDLIEKNNNLSCRPCTKIGFNRCPAGHFKCMNELKFDNIIL